MSRARCVLAVAGLDCPNEVGALRAALEGRPGVLGLGFDLIHGSLTVDYDATATSPDDLIRRIGDAARMRASLVGRPEATVPSASSWWERNGPWLETGLAGLALAAGLGLGWAEASPLVVRGAFLVAIAVGLWQLLPRALRALRQGRLDMHVLMAIAVAGAVALGQWDEAATVAFLFGLSEALESLSLERARRAVRRLLDVAPETAELLDEAGGVRVVAASEVGVGQRVRVRSGERIPVDGEVLSGRSSVDQKAITGESVPVGKEPGDEVYAGTVNGEGGLEVRATRPLDDSVVSRIVTQVRAAQANRAPVVQGIERFAAVYTPVVVGLAVLVMVGPPLAAWLVGAGASEELWRSWFQRGLVLLVIACPCALVIGTPVAIVSGLAAAFRRGILVKGGPYLELFGRLKVLAFDKTGTLTRGQPDVVEVVTAGGGCDRAMLRVAAALGDRGGHVLGRAIARHARGLELDVPEAEDYQAVPGLGATGQVEEARYHIGSHRYIDQVGLCADPFHATLGEAERGAGTSVAVTAPEGPLGYIRLADRPRPEASDVLAELRALGIRTVMLTGDNSPTAAAVAAEVGLDDYRAALLPGEKAREITQLDAEAGPTGMVGDGVNDAPALAAARVSVALGGISSAAAIETADVVLMAEDLSDLPWLVRHSRRTMRRVWENVVLAVGSKVLVMGLAVAGLANLWMAIAADVGVSLLVVANALRLLSSR